MPSLCPLLAFALFSIVLHLIAGKSVLSTEIGMKKRLKNTEHFALMANDDDDDDNFVYNKSPDYEQQTLRSHWLEQLYKFVMLHQQLQEKQKSGIDHH
ncbi:unnamed protein product [Didymodactylos carnosus]|uniref:Uncharacterized protein n=1 Tax=Didymodactylos carnosus TaxID=1234261 RepID=A0A815BJZ5_9BILA|nr:unnamed protein product [Didymodactylos carnosus]CAF4054050.1 unnamed protein product [Didymodactylos carnosus]